MMNRLFSALCSLIIGFAANGYFMQSCTQEADSLQIQVESDTSAVVDSLLDLPNSAVVDTGTTILSMPDSAAVDTSTTAATQDTLVQPIMEIQADAQPMLNYDPREGVVHVAGGEAPPLLRCNPARQTPTVKRVCPPFYLDRTEVTNRQFACFLSSADSNAVYHDRRMNILMVKPGVYRARLGKELEPVTFVNWFGAWSFARWAGKTLPTEEDWVLAALGSAALPDTGSIYPWGTEPADGARANGLNINGFPVPHPVGSHPAGATTSGLLDMAGNVAEWTTTEETLSLPDSTTKRFMVIKGGSFLDPVENLTLTARAARDPHECLGSVGFRCLIRDLSQP
jgi:formylglycine-generating enzyme required for sulfatase activity